MWLLFVCSGPNRGHYIAIVKSHDFWLLFDDDIVEVHTRTHLHTTAQCVRVLSCYSRSMHVDFSNPSPCPLQKIDAQAIEEFYGLTSEISKNSESGYILFYQSRD